jgi:hypothetical protein
VLIGFSRMYLGVHYFSDVIAGYAAGGVWLSALITGAEDYPAWWQAREQGQKPNFVELRQCELRRTPRRRTSENSTSTHSGE